MRSTIPIHLPSAALGLLAALGLAALMGFRTLGPQTQETALARGPYAWRSLVRIEENYPYTVPEGKVLILVGSGYTWRGDIPNGLAQTKTRLLVTINGEQELVLDPIDGPATIEPGWAVAPKARVSVQFGSDQLLGYAFGYVVDA